MVLLSICFIIKTQWDLLFRQHDCFSHLCLACDQTSFKLFLDAEKRAKSGCAVVKIYSNRGTPDECAASACYYQANVFQIKACHGAFALSIIVSDNYTIFSYLGRL